MPRKTKIIFIIVFIFVGAIMLGIYFYNSSSNPTTSSGGVTSFYKKFNPFGSSGNTTVDNAQTDQGITGGNTIDQGLKTNSRFQKITDFAVAGASYLEDERISKANGTPELVPSLRYVGKENGHVYQMYLDTKVEGKISNSTIPGVHEALFDGKSNSIIYRYLSSDKKSITSFLAQLGGVAGGFLVSNISDISLSPTGDKFFYLVKTQAGSLGIIRSFSDTKTNSVFNSSLSEWLPQWVTEQNILLTTKPSYLVNGSVFSLNPATGTTLKLFGGIPGLTTLANKSGLIVLYGASLDTGPKLNIFDLTNHKSLDLDTYGLPEKCVWSIDNINIYCAVPNTIVGTQYPDSWYQGITSFEDRFVKINTTTKETSMLGNSADETPVDAVDLFLNKTENKLFFINKKDYTLWSFDL